MHHSRCAEPLPPAVARGIEEFNQEKFFEQHETLEIAWRAERDAVRDLYQGILQVGVGLYHLRRGNLRGAERLLARGLTHLEPVRPCCMGVDVERFVEQSQRCLAAVRALRSGTSPRFDSALIPKVRFATG